MLKVVDDVPYFSGKSMKIFLKADLTPSPDAYRESVNAELAQHDFPVNGDGNSFDQLANPVTKTVCSEIGIQTDILEEPSPMPIGSRSLVESSGFTACPSGVTKGKHENSHVDAALADVGLVSGLGTHAVCGWCNHSVSLAERPLYRAKTATDSYIVHFLDCNHCKHQA